MQTALKTLEATALRTQEQAGAAHKDMIEAMKAKMDPAFISDLRNLYKEAAEREQAAYDAWKAAGGKTA